MFSDSTGSDLTIMLVTVQQSPGTPKDGDGHVLDFSWELHSTSQIAVLS